ncbi:hypothetical protein [Nocardia sp. NPDC051463]|uniref:hypothetical protein n=1 Tax=Nocardia sp. NPDC051463 TaxID=3154845 RepID=UPI003427EFC8
MVPNLSAYMCSIRNHLDILVKTSGETVTRVKLGIADDLRDSIGTGIVATDSEEALLLARALNVTETIPSPYEFVALERQRYTDALMHRGEILVKKADKLVPARPATEGEIVKCILQSGHKETDYIAKANDMVVTQPRGEFTVHDPKSFTAGFEATDQPGMYRPIGVSRVIKNDTGYPIATMAPWGRIQTGDTNCSIAERIHDGDEPHLDRYLLGNEERITNYNRPTSELRARLEQNES